MNISSAIVIPNPDRVQAVVAKLAAVPGVEVAAVSPEGKIIVTIEADGDRSTVGSFEQVSLLDGVMSASMVYHQQENEPEAEILLAA
jgi:nitrate reductase NapD